MLVPHKLVFNELIICWASSQEHIEFNLVRVVIFLRGSDPPKRPKYANVYITDVKTSDYTKDWKMANMIYIIMASQNVKIPVQMDLIPGQMVNSWTILTWMVGMCIIAYKNLNKMRGKN